MNLHTAPRPGRTFTAPDLLQIAMPMGGIGAGCICLSGQGGLQDFSIRGLPAVTALADRHDWRDAGFALLHIKGERPATKLLEAPLPPEKLYDQGLQGQGYRHGGQEGLPRFQRGTFEARYPFGRIALEDDRLPLAATVTGWSPLVPNDDRASGLPCAILEYTFENKSAETVEFEFSYHLSHLAVGAGGWSETRTRAISEGPGGGVFFTSAASPDRDDFGSAALYAIGQTPQIKASWFRGGWFDGISVLWQEVSAGRFRPSAGDDAAKDARSGGSVLLEGRLAPGETVTYPVVIAWHFPNRRQDPDAPQWTPFYAGQWPDARAVALDAAAQYADLRRRTLAFTDALWSSTLPDAVLDAVASNLAILKSPTVLRQKNGNVWGWEGCFVDSGCCHGTCTHVWNYAQSLPHLFPKLERTLREQELVRSMDDAGHVNFRASLPDGPAPHDFYAAADGQLGGILKLFRDFHISGDRDWLAGLYPAARRSLDYCIKLWDPERRGLLFEPHHNTYDIEFWGPDGMCSSIYIAALAAFGCLARALGKDEDAAPYEDLAERGAALMDSSLFNGEYYQQNVAKRNVPAGGSLMALDEESRLFQAEGPKYQYGTGCLSDGVIGAWMAAIYGIPTPLNPAHVQSTLSAIFRHNFREDLFDHVCLQRPGYALGHEAGLLLCTWPQGGKLTLPFPYSDEVWTGIEYQVASHFIEEGMVEEGLKLVEAVRSRYEGRTRNPFNEYECGNYYARAMASYALLGSLSGFRYSAASRTLWFGPKLGTGPFRCFFSAAGGHGVIALAGGRLSLELLEGELTLDRVVLTQAGQTREIPWSATVRAGQTISLETADGTQESS